MQQVDAGEAWVFRPDGTVELTTEDTSSCPSWLNQVMRRCDESAPASAVRVEDDTALLMAWRLRGSATPTGLRTLVFARPKPAWIAGAQLTVRQREVSEFAAVGATVREISRHFEISLHTVRTHLKAAYRELEVCNRVELARALNLLG